MANVHDDTSPKLTIYKYRASGYYIVGEDKNRIEYTNIKSIVIDHDYVTNNMPLMYVILSLSTKVVDKIIKNKETGTFIINIQKSIDNTDSAILWEDYINDTFIYFLAEDINKTDTRDYEASNDGREDIYKEITVGLLSKNLVNNNKKTVNGIINANNMASAVAYCVGVNRPLVMEPFENNASLKRLIMPPKNSVAKCIAYLNSIKTFYNTNYTYYMDYDASYLMSSRGKPVPRKGDKYNTVMLTLRNDYDSASKLQGMSVDEKNRYYNVEINASNAEVADYREKSKSYTKLSYTNTDGTNSTHQSQEITANRNFANKTLQVRVPNGNEGLVLNTERVSRLYISVNKTDLDNSIFNINKEYIVAADEVYSDSSYSGKYILRRRRELYFKASGGGADDKFTASTLLVLEKVFEG